MQIGRRAPRAWQVKLRARDLSLDPEPLALLRAINEGVREFVPEDQRPATLVSFQQKVKLLRMLESRRYLAEISGLNLRLTENGSSIDRVRLRGCRRWIKSNDSGRYYFHCGEKLRGLPERPSSDLAQTLERIFNVRVHDVVVDGSIRNSPRCHGL